MKKEIFKLRHAALVTALALAMGAPLAFADEAPVEVSTDVVALPGDGIGVGMVVGDGAVVDPQPTVGDNVTIDPPALPVEGGDVVLTDPIPVEAGELMPEEAAPVEGNDVVVLDEVPVVEVPVVEVPAEEVVPVEGNEVVIDETPAEEVPMDDCGVICQNVAGEPEPAVYKSDDVAPEVMQFGSNSESPDPALNVSAELSGAVGVAEQLGAADIALQDGTAVDPLVMAAPATVVARATTRDSVSVIRDGHLR